MKTHKTIQQQPSSALSLSPKWLQMYDSFITKNQSSITSIESALQSLTYMIPGRFRDAELASESLHCSIQLLSMYHDTVLLRSSKKSSGLSNIQSLHNRYTKYWTQRSRPYRQVALLLSIIRYTELLWEMIAKRRGERVRWRVVVMIEAIKACCRLFLLRTTNSRPIVNPILPARETISEASLFTEDGSDEVAEYGQLAVEKEYHMKRTGLHLPMLPNSADISGYLTSRVLTADNIKAPETLLNQVYGSAHLAECLYIIQPLIYSIARSRCRNKKSWQPWLLGFSLECAARQIRKNGVNLTTLEREQWGKRSWAMAWWLMRGAFYENIMRNFLHRTSQRLPGLLLGVLEDYIYLWDEYYFSTSSN
ncbi:BgTH12-03414 [Blumeria graminis f. sp. triticale]|uniref:Peroxisomal membrane protein PEX16 n=3 Tax=Blumeria graminis TaxID=34373 RepID=A0A061HE07_BLUGR|nr:Peroxisomal membrane protein Pex16 [Blumeria graminis f. sp. tritici 96224]CAD6499294.1 BgTH12-03414 [Blumeria graminis f. sp. triticale]VCU39417.1 Bgt-3689 [Blumeria graminis f. sp. tritici]